MKKLVLIVIDGLTAAVFETAVNRTRTPALAFLAEHGAYRRAVSTFPSLTPVCLSSIATGAHPDVHEIPHLVWYRRGERRLVEYGSSFGAIRAAGMTRSIRDTVLAMNGRHLGARAVTVFEAIEDAGLTPACVNFTCYRGRTRHRASVPGVPPVYGPRRFFYYNLFESDATGAPLAVRNRAGGTVDAYAAAVSHRPANCFPPQARLPAPPRRGGQTVLGKGEGGVDPYCPFQGLDRLIELPGAIRPFALEVGLERS